VVFRANRANLYGGAIMKDDAYSTTTAVLSIARWVGRQAKEAY